jgi:hypothetical protein
MKLNNLNNYNYGGTALELGSILKAFIAYVRSVATEYLWVRTSFFFVGIFVGGS